MKDAFLPAYGPTPFSSFLSMAIAMGALSTEDARHMAQQEGGMERTEEEQIFDQGCLAAQFGRYEEAMEVFTGLLVQRPDDRAVLYNRGLSYLCLNRYEEAEADFEDIHRHEPGRSNVLVNLSHLFLVTKIPARAQQEARRVLQFDPHSPAGAVNLGHSLIFTGRLSEAEEAYRCAVPTRLDDEARARLIAGMAEDMEEFRRADWPGEKLEEMALQLRCLELKLTRKEMLEQPAVNGRDGFLGAKLEILQARSDFFTWFHFEPVESGEQIEGLVEFKPSGPAFRSFVTLRVITGQNMRIATISLDIARRFIDNPKDGIFAADLAKSFLRNAAAPPDRTVLDALASEIEANARSTSPVIMTANAPQHVSRAQPLSPAACVFYGRTESWETRLARSQLTFSQLETAGELIFRIDLKSLTVGGPVRGNTTWLNQLWTNLSERKK